MTALLDHAVSELKKRADRVQDDIARDILARIGEPPAQARRSVIGRGKPVLHRADPKDDLVDLLADDEIGAWYAVKPAAT